MQALTPAIVASMTGLSAYLTQTSWHSASNHVGDPHIALSARAACTVCFKLRRRIAGSPSHPAESSSLYCRLPVRFRLLSTQLRSSAVTFGYRALAYPDTDLHRAVCAPSRTHDPRVREDDVAKVNEIIPDTSARARGRRTLVRRSSRRVCHVHSSAIPAPLRQFRQLPLC
jgi:hypothetical protein